MFSAWDMNSWLGSVGVVLFMGGLITAFAALVNAVLVRIWRDEQGVGEASRMRETAKETAARKAA
jgi:hypothetical protein